jgi:2-polyprenyl-6-methoxyphenol hydroxylase-like FAD-dependent oxidoreductase
MIGDAAHRMPPYAGEGVNMAMLDALDLAEALTNQEFNSIEHAFAHFEKQMCMRASEVTRITLDQTESLHSAAALDNLLKMLKTV